MSRPDEHECDFPDTCPVCRGPVRTDPEPVTVEARFAARFPGDCPACHLGIHEGQPIAKLSNGRYVHDHCTED